MAEANPDYMGLDNDELRFIFYRFNDYKKQLDKNLEKGQIVSIVNMPVYGEMPGLQPICAEHAREVRESEFYRLLTGITDKLGPIVEFMETDERSRFQPIVPPASCMNHPQP